MRFLISIFFSSFHKSFGQCNQDCDLEAFKTDVFFLQLFLFLPGFFLFLLCILFLGTAKRRTGHQPRTKRRPLVHSARNGTHRDRGFWEFYRHRVAKRTGTVFVRFCSFFVRFCSFFVVASVTDIPTTILVFRW